MGAIGESLNSQRQFLLHLARRKLDAQIRQKVAASDLVQKTLLNAFEHWGSFRGDSDEELRKWLAVILHHQYLRELDTYRSAQKRAIALEKHSLTQHLPSPTPTASIIAVSRESIDKLLQAISTLSNEHQDIIRLRHIEHRSLDEISTQLSISRHTAYRRWKAALKQLASQLKHIN